MTFTTVLSNPIYQHSGESEKVCPIAIQASINEDIEKRRRQLDHQGEARRIIVAKEISHLIDESGSIALQKTPYVHVQIATETPFIAVAGAIEAGKAIVDSATTATLEAAGAVAGTGKALAQGAAQATLDAAGAVAGTGKALAHGAAVATLEAADTGKSIINNTKIAASNAAAATLGAADSAAHAAIGAANTAAHVALEAADNAAYSARSAANTAVSMFSNAASFVGHLVGSAAAGAAHAAHNVVDKTADVAGAVGQAALDVAGSAAHKAHEIADNITRMTALVTVLAAEEKERARRLIDGDEAFAVINAMKVAELIRGLGIAFYKQETPNLSYGTKLLEEMERKWRLTSPYAAFAATNAHAVGQLFTANTTLPHLIPRAQMVLAHIHNIEDKERTRRMNSSDEVYAMLNAFATRDIIRGLGWEFYRQEGAFSRLHGAYAATLLEENERLYRISTEKLLHAEDSAHHLMETVSDNLAKFSFTTKQAALAVNDFMGKLGTATRQAASTFSEKGMELTQTTLHRAQELGNDVSSFASRMYILALEEKERVRRMSDIDEIYAIQNAWFQASLISELYPTRLRLSYPTALLEEVERSYRIAFDTKETRARAHAVATIVHANHARFEAISGSTGHVLEVAATSRLNPNAAPFVPSHPVDPFVLATKVEPAPVRSLRAAGAQL